ncbi:MAG: hypothetical protein U9Q90_11385 [Campylobacterota bacterium]|nr:hypothetical protein [Campylobacterota bacterium]
MLITLSLFFASTATFSAEESFTVDTLERMLEMDRHKQLITQKKNSKSTLSAFTTDGCSGGLSVGWEYLAGKIQGFQVNHGAIPPWQACCIKHDQAYHTGGERDNNATKSFEDRKKADLALRACVFDTGDTRAAELQKEYQLSREEVHRLYIVIADLMYRAVRVGGMPCTGLPWRWGYGWPKCE